MCKTSASPSWNTRNGQSLELTGRWRVAGDGGTQYYLRLTADAYPEVIATAQLRFGYVIPTAALEGQS